MKPFSVGERKLAAPACNGVGFLPQVQHHFIFRRAELNKEGVQLQKHV